MKLPLVPKLTNTRNLIIQFLCLHKARHITEVLIREVSKVCKAVILFNWPLFNLR